MDQRDRAPDIRQLDRRATEACMAAVADVTAGDLGRPTPCAGWTVRDLLDHLAAQHRGFAAAASGDGGDLARWQVQPAADPVAAHQAAAEEVLAAFAADGVLDRPFVLAEFDPVAAFPAAMAIGFHFVDHVVHAWDVARSLGRPWAPDPELVLPALDVARQVPDGAEREEPGAAFAPSLAVGHAVDPFEQVLGLLGRSPLWSP